MIQVHCDADSADSICLLGGPLFWFSVYGVSVCFSRPLSGWNLTRPLFFAARLHREPDAEPEEAQGKWTGPGRQADRGALSAWVLGPLLGLALGTAAPLIWPGQEAR